MTHDDQRIWDVLFEDALNAPHKPDLLHRIHARGQNAAQPVLEVAPTVSQAPQGRRWPRRLRIWAEGAVVALALALIVWVIVERKDSAPEDNGKTPTGFAAAPGARFEKKDGYIVALEGWFALSTGAPEVRAEGCTITDVKGLIVIKTGLAPTAAQWDAQAPWLAQLKLETEMLHKTKNWIVAGVLALAVLQGQATVNGEIIQVPELPGSAPVVVTSIAEIEALPKGTTAVIGRGLKDSHLDFLSRVKSLQWLTLQNCPDVTDTGAGYLAQLDALNYLDVASCAQLRDEGLERLCTLPKLADLSLNAKVAVYTLESKPGDAAKRNATTEKLNSLNSLEITGGSYFQKDAIVHSVTTWLPNITSVSINNNQKLTDTSLKYLAALKRLRSLELSSCAGFTDGGLAYLRDCASLEKLDLSRLSLPNPGARTAIISQIAKMPALTDLTLDGWDFTPNTSNESILAALTISPKLKRFKAGGSHCAQSLVEIAKFANLQELDLSTATIDSESFETMASAFKGLGELKELRVLDLSQLEWRLGALLHSLPVFPKLEVLRLRQMISGPYGSVDDASLARIAQMTTLRELDLSAFVPPKDFEMNSFQQLKALTGLRSLKLSIVSSFNSKARQSLFKDVVAELAKSLPQCKIDTTQEE